MKSLNLRSGFMTMVAMDDQNHHLIIDGGYLSYLLTSSYIDGYYDLSHPLLNTIPIFLDGHNNIRTQNVEDYKGHRVNGNEQQMEMRQKAHAFREQLEGRPNTVIHPELEADDLIALFCDAVFPDTVYCIANDKDMLQIPNIKLISAEHRNVSAIKHTDWTRFNKSINVKSCPTIASPVQIILYLTLIGDKADNIHRILPKGKKGYDNLTEIYNNDFNPFEQCVFYDDFIENLKLVLLPHPHVLKYESIMDVVWALDRYHQGDYVHWSDAFTMKPEFEKLLTEMHVKFHTYLDLTIIPVAWYNVLQETEDKAILERLFIEYLNEVDEL